MCKANVSRLLKSWLLAFILITGGAGAAQAAEFLYATTDAGVIYQYQIGSDGSLQPLTPPRLNVFDQVTQLVLHPSGGFAYAVLVHEIDSGHALAQVQGYRINADGTLTPLEPQPLTLATPADNVAIDPKGRFLFVSGENDRLFTFRIQYNGALTPLADNKDVPTFHIDTQGDGGGELTGTANWNSISFDSTGCFLYLASVQCGFDSRSYDLLPYRLNERGVLHPLGQGFHGTGQIYSCFCTPRGELFVAH